MTLALPNVDPEPPPPATSERGETRRDARERLARVQTLLAESQTLARLGSWKWDVASDRAWWSEELSRIYGLPDGTLEGTLATHLDRVHPDDRATFTTALERCRAERRIVEHDYRVVRLDGAVLDVFGRFKPLADRTGRATGVIGTVQDISEARRADRLLREQAEALRALSYVDELTGLYNRRGFFALARQRLEATPKTSGALALVFADLDGLKQINDRYGHSAGDHAIVLAAGALRSAFRDTDLVARLGGDEFVALACDPGRSGASLVARVHAALVGTNASEGTPYAIGVSAGVVTFDPRHPESVEDLIARADAAMYDRKRARRAPDEAALASGVSPRER